MTLKREHEAITEQFMDVLATATKAELVGLLTELQNRTIEIQTHGGSKDRQQILRDVRRVLNNRVRKF